MLAQRLESHGAAARQVEISGFEAGLRPREEALGQTRLGHGAGARAHAPVDQRDPRRSMAAVVHGDAADLLEETLFIGGMGDRPMALAERPMCAVRPLERDPGAAMLGDLRPQGAVRLLEPRRARAHLGLQVELEAPELHVGSDPSQDLLGLKRLGDVVHAAQPEPLELVGRILQRRQEDHRNVAGPRVRLEAPAHLEAVEAGHADVEQDEIRRLDSRGGEAELAAQGGADGVARASQELGEQPEGSGRVLNYEDVAERLR